MTKYNIEVKGIHCKSCNMLVTDALQELGASQISIKLDEKNKIGKVSFDFLGDKKKAIETIEKEGYKVSK